jgi:hypothetical protein
MLSKGPKSLCFWHITPVPVKKLSGEHNTLVHGFLLVFQESMRVAAAVCMDWRMTNVIDGFFFSSFSFKCYTSKPVKKELKSIDIL